MTETATYTYKILITQRLTKKLRATLDIPDLRNEIRPIKRKCWEANGAVQYSEVNKRATGMMTDAKVRIENGLEDIETNLKRIQKNKKAYQCITIENRGHSTAAVDSLVIFREEENEIPNRLTAYCSVLYSYDMLKDPTEINCSHPVF